MKKSLEKMRVRIDQNLNRSEKTIALPLELEKLEETVLIYKQVCSFVHKRLCEYLPSAGKGTDGLSVERRLKKTSDVLLGQSLIEQGRLLNKQKPQTCLGQILLATGGVCTSIGSHLVQYEISVEQLVIQQLEAVLKTDLPAIIKQRKMLDQLILELDTAKARLTAAQTEEKQMPGVISGSGKVERCIEELDDMDRRVEMARDTLATDMMAFLAKDTELAAIISKFLDYKLEYHSSLVDQIQMTQPKVDSILHLKRGYPIWGSNLSTHLSSFNLPSGIAYPIQVCVSRLAELGLDEEGLFRLAAGSSKVKRLKAEIETPGLPILLSLEAADHHVLTGIIKSYLRELPEPLFGGNLYNEWLEAGQCEDADERADLIFNLLQHDNLPMDNFRNIQYLFRLLYEVSEMEDRNKMSASNLAIVITPNVIWDNEGTSDPLDITVSSCLSKVVEQIISQYQWFFKNDSKPSQSWDYNLPGSLSPVPLSFPDSSHLPTPTYTPPIASHVSPTPNTRDRKNKVKKAPLPPSGESRTTSHQKSNSANTILEAGFFNSSILSSSDSSPPRNHLINLTVNTKEHDKEVEIGFDKLMLDAKDTLPVPAPRTLKPAIPNKPEGISRNASMKASDNRKQPGTAMDKESTNL